MYISVFLSIVVHKGTDFPGKVIFMEKLIPAGVFIILTLNLAGFFMMGYDKSMAGRHKRRIPEKTLIAVSIIGGAVGIMLGMRCFHHKTRHALFVYGIPALLLVNLVLFHYIYRLLV